ncbi:MAG: 30S ribosomal protein S16 [Bacteroidota bacterium]|nr:30S ribosomal protein S16 [Bacteroidota bacterium]MDP4205301.1 30S ribosomal protein S16 [Bacteroidota bacterium]
MATKIRLARHGRKRRPYYYIIVADSRAPRDGKFIERIGSFNPVTNPATIDLDFEKALKWVMTGAQPTDTVRTILSKEGVMMKKHLLEGVKKGAFDEAEAEKRYAAWAQSRDSKKAAEQDKITAAADADLKQRLDAEKEVNAKRAAAIAAKQAEEAAVAAEAQAEEATEEASEDQPEANTEA